MNLVYPVFGLLNSALRGMSTRWYGYGYAMVMLQVRNGTGCVYESAVAWSRRSITQGLKMDSSSTSLQSAVYAMHWDNSPSTSLQSAVYAMKSKY
jgi:hypothetical protein